MKKLLRESLLPYLIVCGVICTSATCSKHTPSEQTVIPANGDMQCWLTRADHSVLLQQQNEALVFGTASNQLPTINVDSTQQYQSIDGFGYTLTGASAGLIMKMAAQERAALLQELFGNGNGAISISYLRISIGASDLNEQVFSYDDMPAGQTDVGLDHFSLGPDHEALIPVLQQILAINPDIKILGSPWSPPVWMKDNHSSVGGSLLSEYYNVYGAYFVKYVQAMAAEGIKIDAITPQNEPLNPGNNPSMYMTAAQEDSFITYSLGPAFRTNNIDTKIILYDHNCDHPEYPMSILADARALPFIDGSAFHLYAGEVSALSVVHNSFPTKNIYFTEQYTSSDGTFGGDLMWHVKNVVIGSARNWSRNALEWNLASDPAYSLHTPGGCTTCKGAITLDGNNITRNVGYYIIAHASRFVPAGSVRIASNIDGDLNNVAFRTPAGKKVLLVQNEGSSDRSFNIAWNGKWVTTTLPAASVATYVW